MQKLKDLLEYAWNCFTGFLVTGYHLSWFFAFLVITAVGIGILLGVSR